MRWLIAILFLTIGIHSAVAEDFSRRIGTHGTSGSSGTDGLDEFNSQTDGSFPPGSENPSPAEQKRLVVEWGTASMGYMDDSDEQEDGEHSRRIWKDDDALRPDRRLAIRGQLLIESADKKSRKPINWIQGVRVIVSRLPVKKHDWSKRQEMHDAVWDDFVISEEGEFLATFPPGELQRAVGKDLKFQVGLSLGKKTEYTIRWKNTVGVLPQSVTMLTVPGPPSIDATMQIINGAPSYEQNDFNPAKLVRAVNHLIPMGKEKAIEALRSYLGVACEDGTTVRMDENIDTSDRTGVFLIIRLLFEAPDPGNPFPGIATVPFTPTPKDADKKLWPLHPIGMQEDLPFFLVYGGGGSGSPDQPEELVDWAEQHGKMRTKLLRPPDNPMIAAGRLIALPQTKRLYAEEIANNYYIDLLYRQAWNIIEDADPKIPKPKPIPANEPDYVDWQVRAKSAADLKIHWDEKTQKYIMK